MSKNSSIIFAASPHKPFGLSYENWTIKWWRWLMSIPISKNPAFDLSGDYCHINQNDPKVWFLAGTFGGYAERKCSIGLNKAILFPIINIEATLGDTKVSNEKDLLAYTQNHINEIDQDGLILILDNKPITNLGRYRVKSPVFNLSLQSNNILNLPPGATKATSDGYWIMLRPLTKGIHTLLFSGSCLSGIIRIGVKYEITVK